MNQVFHEYLNKFVVVYLDDIVVYNSTLEEEERNNKNWRTPIDWSINLSISLPNNLHSH